MARNTRYDMEMFNEWLKDRPACIQELAAKYPPNRLYSYAPHGQLVTLESYFEDGTVSVSIEHEFNRGGLFGIMGEICNRSVFGIPVDKLTECDLPEHHANEDGDWVNESSLQ